MNAPISRLLRQLNARISTTRDPRAFDCLCVERACYLARQGNFVEARTVIGAVRKRRNSEPDAEITSWLNLAEGLVSYFSELGSAAHDKILRAHALSVATGLVPLNALAAAWLAQMDFSRLDPKSLAQHVAEALRLSSPDLHSARCRASLVIAQALHLAGRWDLAAPWYTRARLHATDAGDDLSISALMHNMVSMRLDHFRQVVLTGQGQAEAATFALVGIESSANFDHLIGTSTLEAIRPLMRARFLSLQERTAEALLTYEMNISGGVAASLSRLESDVLSDVAWCRLLHGDVTNAKDAARLAEGSLTSGTQVDDRAATHSRLAKFYMKLGETENSEKHALLADVAWQDFTALQQQFVRTLERITETGFGPTG